MISKKLYTADGSTGRFLSDFIIRSEQFARPYVYVYDNTLNPDGSEDVLQDPGNDWEYPTNLYRRGKDIADSADLVTVDKWQVVDNSILFFTKPNDGDKVWVEVATTSEEFGETLTAPIIERAEDAADRAEDAADEAEEWAKVAQSGVKIEEYTTATEGQTIVNTVQDATQADVFLNGIKLTYAVDYTTTTSTVTLITALEAGDNITIQMGNILPGVIIGVSGTFLNPTSITVDSGVVTSVS